MRNIIFPAYPNAPQQLNPYFNKEKEAAEAAGFGISLVSDENTSGRLTITNRTADSYIYRGWIVKPTYYQEMCQLVGNSILNTYHDYMSSHELPNWYKHFTTDDTAQSFIVPADEIVAHGLEEVARWVADYFGNDEPLMLKDYLKSLKHEWYDACYIKDVSDVPEIQRIMQNFFILRGKDFVGGLVFRKFLQLTIAGIHPKTRVPVPVEYRIYYLHGKPFFTTSIWEKEGVYYGSEAVAPPQQLLESWGKKLISPFVGIDAAKGVDGKWWMIEVNDGGAAGLPEHMDFQDFYQRLYNGA